MKNAFLLIAYFLLFLPGLGQEMILRGAITDQAGNMIPGITVTIKGTNTGSATDLNGNFTLNIPQNSTLIISGVGYKTQEIKAGNNQTLKISLEEDTKELEAVQIIGKSETMEIREKPYTVSAIDVKPLKVQNLDINQILNSTTGVRIREEGGLGSNFNFSLNGFSGNQVKFFLDGIPMDYFGSSLSLNNIPSNMISKIEVYKGVVPVHLGADALGGAVNVTTDRSIRNFLNLSYSIGSFNTHRASVISRATTKNDFVVNLNGFFNYSDNNYKIDAEVVNTETGKVSEEVVERFHDGYQSQSAQFEVGVENKPYADRLFLGLIASSNEKEIQSGYNLTVVVGEAFATDKVLIPTFKYQKENLLIDDLSLSVNATYKHGISMRVDTSSRQYNWRGEYSIRGLGVTAGEISWYKTRFRFTDDAAMSSANLSYRIDNKQSISINNTYSYYTRVGDDPISPESVPFSEPNTLKKNILGVSYNISLLQNNLKSVVFGKMFHMDALTRAESEEFNSDELVKLTNVNTYYGFGAATTYFITDEIQIKASYENTYRLPEVLELFGNGLQVLSNATLEAEKSQNFNLGALARQNWNKHQIVFETSYLFRLPKDLIRNSALGNTSKYENLPAAKANIFEADIKYDYNRRFNIQINGTYQNIVNDQQRDPKSGAVNYLYGARIPNTPFLYGNAKAGVMFHNVGSETGKVSINWSTAFVEAFYLKWPVYGDASTKADIPRQLSHSLSASYSLHDGRYNISASCTNLTDEALYDNFMLQKPGRAFNLKLSYFLQ